MFYNFIEKFLQCILTSFQEKNIGVFHIFTFRNFNETLVNNIVSFEQPGPEFYLLQMLSSSF